MIGTLELYGNPITLYGVELVLYGDSPTPTEERLGGAWFPVIYVDKEGKPVDLDAKIETAVEAAREPEQIAAIEAVSGRMDDAKWIVANDMAREAEIVLQYLDRMDAYLAEMIRQDIARAVMEADENDAIAILMLMH